MNIPINFQAVRNSVIIFHYNGFGAIFVLTCVLQFLVDTLGPFTHAPKKGKSSNIFSLRWRLFNQCFQGICDGIATIHNTYPYRHKIVGPWKWSSLTTPRHARISSHLASFCFCWNLAQNIKLQSFPDRDTFCKSWENLLMGA